MVAVVHQRCAGLDIHKTVVVACAIVPDSAGQPVKEVRSFGTLTDQLLALGDWLAEQGVSHVAMEATGSYWKPVYNLLEEQFTLLLVNARHIKQVPGRKTDVKDSEWIADLLRHGLLRASFVPDRPQRELRELTRYRTSLVRERAAEVNRVHKTLVGANVQLGAVATDVLGRSGRAILEALLAGSDDAHALAELAQGKLRAKRPALERALVGRISAHQRFLLRHQLTHIEQLDQALEQLDAEIAERLRPFDQQLEHLDSLPGVGRRTAEVLLAEVGADMGRFPSAAHLASWAGLCPGNHESAGQRLSGRTRKGNRWLRQALVEAAHAAGRTKSTLLGAQYRRLVRRKGTKKAAVAVAHTLLVTAYYLLSRAVAYQELPAPPLGPPQRHRLERRLVSGLQALGYRVELTPWAA